MRAILLVTLCIFILAYVNAIYADPVLDEANDQVVSAGLGAVAHFKRNRQWVGNFFGKK